MTQHYPSDPHLSARTESWRSTLPRRSRNHLLVGVCGGLAEYWGVSPTIVRLGCLALALAADRRARRRWLSRLSRVRRVRRVRRVVRVPFPFSAATAASAAPRSVVLRTEIGSLALTDQIAANTGSADGPQAAFSSGDDGDVGEAVGVLVAVLGGWVVEG